jgi:hypothetical protein
MEMESMQQFVKQFCQQEPTKGTLESIKLRSQFALAKHDLLALALFH